MNQFFTRLLFKLLLITSVQCMAVIGIAQTVSVTTQPVNKSACPNGNVSFSITASGATSYQWQVSTNNGSSFATVPAAAPYSGVTTSTLTITGITSAMSGYRYRCVVNGSSGSATSNAAILTMTALLGVPVVYEASFTNGQSYCPGTAPYDNWVAFRSKIVAGQTYKRLTISGSLLPGGITCDDPAAATQLAEALRTGTAFSITVAGRTWYVSVGCNAGCAGAGEAVELNVDNGFCACGAGPTVRPCIGNSNWGGLGGTSCNGATQTMKVELVGGASIDVTNVSCNGGNNGKISVNVTDGDAPYNYVWSPGTPSGQGTETISNLTAGSYSVVVTDATGCSASVNYTVTEPALLVASAVSQTNLACHGGSNGAATVSASGGVAPYTYSWAPSGGTAATATGLSAGTYTVTVTDANGCSATKSFTLTEPAAITASAASQTNISCNGATNGAVTVTAGGGTGAYTYSWAPSGGTAATATGLGAGTYTVTVKDANGCTATNDFTITQPDVLVASPSSKTNVACNGGATGSATTSVIGGTAPYTYTWSSGGSTAATAGNLTAGAYTVTVKDANGCTATQNFTITQPTALTTSSLSQTNVACNGAATGAANVGASGGTAPYSYAWSPAGGTAANATGLAAGKYTVTVTDANSCTATRDFTITQPAALTTTGSQVNVSCNGGSNGSATVTASGGTGSYIYAWSPVGGTAATATGFTAGTYTVTVQDANACTTTRNFTITQPAVLTATATQTNVTCDEGTNGSATVNVSGGTSAYSYSWSPAVSTTATAAGLAPGDYRVTIKDANNCTTTSDIKIIIGIPSPAAPVASVTAQPTCTVATGTIQVSSPTGLRYAIDNGAFQTSSTFTGVAAGTHRITVTNSAGCTRTGTDLVVTAQPPSPPVPVITASGASSFCNGGSVTLTSSAGSGNQWLRNNGVITGAAATSYTANTSGDYIVQATNSNGCSTRSLPFTVTVYPVPAQPVISASGPLSFCEGGSVVLSVPTATAYRWSNNATTREVTVTTSSVYAVSTQNANGCWSPQSNSVAVTSNPYPVFTVSSDRAPAISRGSTIRLTASNTSGSIAWSPATGLDMPFSFSPLARPMATTKYTASVTSNAGCTTSRDITITVIDDYKVTPKKIITPNGDGQNDYFVIDNIDAYPNNVLQIFDRSGKKVYEKQGYRNDWNGMIRNRPFVNDTYFYVIFLEGKLIKKGSVTILK